MAFDAQSASKIGLASSTRHGSSVKARFAKGQDDSFDHMQSIFPEQPLTRIK